MPIYHERIDKVYAFSAVQLGISVEVSEKRTYKSKF